MTFIVNLSTTLEYSIDKTLAAFVQLCNRYSDGCLQSMPGFFQQWTNYAWVIAQYQLNYKSLIEPYKLGKVSTADFLDKLSSIFYFMKDMDRNERHRELASAWNASIKMTDKTKARFDQLIELSHTETVYLISNTNELNAQANIELIKQTYPNLRFNRHIDLSIEGSKEPVELLRNVYLCFSYRYGAFKEETASTPSLLEHLVETCTPPVTLLSQFSGDLKKAEQLGIARVLNVEDFDNISHTGMKKNQ